MGNYESWERRVKEIFSARVGVELDDLPDVPMRDFFDQGMSPKQTVVDIMAYMQDMGDLEDDLFDMEADG